MMPEEIGKEFGPRVKDLVMVVSNMEIGFKKYNLEDNRTKAQELGESGDKEAVLIKLCDHLHNMETLKRMSLKKKQNKAKKTIEIYLPLARKHQFDVIAEKLEAISQKYITLPT